MIVIWNKDKEMDWTKPSVYPIHREHSYRIKNSFFRVSGISANSFKIKGFFSAVNYCSLF
jgi:hypothetical protein